MTKKIIDWSQAVCVGADDVADFYEDEHRQAIVAEVYCTFCPIKIECAQYAIDHNEEFGVWGGLTEGVRRKMYSKRNRVKCPSCLSHDVARNTFTDDGVEVCRSCGLSWVVGSS